MTATVEAVGQGEVVVIVVVVVVVPPPRVLVCPGGKEVAVAVE